MLDNTTAVKIDKVYKNFRLPHEKSGSIKSLFTSIHKKRDKGFETQHALKNISLEVKKGEFFGIVGRNGSGKSTLLKIIAEIYQPTSGTVERKGRLVPFIELGVGFNPELSGRENVYLNGALLGFSKNEIDDMYDDIVKFAELEKFMDQKLKNYSSGMQVRLAFSVATRSKADILLIDEVLAVGDADFQRKCFDYFIKIKRDDITVIFVSHDMSAIQQYCDRAALIEKNEIVTIDKASKVATMYNKLFLSEDQQEESKRQSKNKSPSGEERWGDFWAKWKNVSIRPAHKNKNGETDTFIISATGIAYQEIDRPIFGFSIKDATFKQLVGTNTIRKNITLKPIKKGQKFTVTWEVANILNRGTHYVDCTIAHDQASLVSDRWPDAVEFEVYREEDNPYPAYTPDIRCEMNVDGKERG